MNLSNEDLIVGSVVFHECSMNRREEEMRREINRLEKQYQRSNSSDSVDGFFVRMTTYAVTIIVLIIVAEILGI